MKDEERTDERRCSWSRKDFVKGALFLAVLALVVKHAEELIGGIQTFLSVLKPVFIGAVIAFILNTIMVRLEKFYFPKSSHPLVRRSRRAVCLSGAVLLVLVGIFIVLLLIVPQLIETGKFVGEKFPVLYDYVDRLSKDYSGELSDFISEFRSLNSLKNFNWKTILGLLSEWWQTLFSWLGGLFGTVLTFFMAFIMSIYILMGKEKLQAGFDRLFRAYLKPKTRERIYYVLKTANETFSGFITGQLLDALILGILCIIGMKILQLPYASMIGTLVGFCALIPIVGVYVSAGVGAMIILTQSASQMLIFLIFFLALQQFEENIIYPRIVGSSVGLPGLWTLVAVIVGVSLYGVIGAILSVPLTGLLFRLVREHMDKKLGEDGSENGGE